MHEHLGWVGGDMEKSEEGYDGSNPPVPSRFTSPQTWLSLLLHSPQMKSSIESRTMGFHSNVDFHGRLGGSKVWLTMLSSHAKVVSVQCRNPVPARFRFSARIE